MTTVVNIKKIVRFREIGLFKDCRAGDAPGFEKYNLIYGFNGSGKTTFSRVLGSLGSGVRHPNLPEEGSFEFQLSDGTLLSSAGSLNALKGRVLVFNTDFIEESFRWKEGAALPVFYIGREQAELAHELDQTLAEAERKRRITEAAREDAAAHDRALSTLKRDLARSISEQLSLGRKYDASKLAVDFEAKPAAGFRVLSEKEQASRRATLAQSEPSPRIPPIGTLTTKVASLLNRTVESANVSAGKMMVDGLFGHEEMRQWILRGLSYHEKNELRECLLCGNALSTKRRADLSKLVDDAFDKLLDDLRLILSELSDAVSNLEELSRTLPRGSDFVPNLQAAAGDALNNLRSKVREVVSVLKGAVKIVSQKLGSPHVAMAPEQLSSLRSAHAVEGELYAEIEKVNTVIRSHNTEVDAFSSGKSKAAAALKGHVLGTNEKSYGSSLANANRARAKHDALEREARNLSNEIDKLRAAVRSHGPAAERITKLIHNYLGRRDLELVTSDDGYRLRRNGRFIRGPLSEGEKTAVAICYFICTLEAEGRQRKDLIVVIDDPVSSLDSRALNYSFSILKASVKDACQVFLLTHNLQFMNEVRKWLKPSTEKEIRKRKSSQNAVASSTLMFLDTVQPGGPETRNCVLKELPKHIRDYESEYHYLMSLILRFVDSEEATDYFFLMPNAVRKALDVFLAFKVPGPEGLGSKVARISTELKGIDPARIQALERLAQMESHSDNLDDLVSFSAATVEEIRDAARTLLDLMGQLDATHLADMKSLCNGREAAKNAA
jgi:wobble nucleotide-excising tRNase